MSLTGLLVAKSEPLLDLCWHIIMYTAIGVLHTRTAAPAYKRTFRTKSNVPLIIHSIASFAEVFRTRVYRIFWSKPYVPDILDLGFNIAHNVTTVMLTKTLRRGSKSFTRPSYYAGVVIRTFVSAAAYALGSPELHLASIRIINAFIYTRTIIWVMNRAGIVPSYANKYGLGVFIAGILGTYESGLPVAVPQYVAFVFGFVLLNRWVSSEVQNRNLQGNKHYPLFSKDRLILLLAHAGVAELDTIKLLENPASLSSEVKDAYFHDDATPASDPMPPSVSVQPMSYLAPPSVSSQIQRVTSGISLRHLNEANLPAISAT